MEVGTSSRERKEGRERDLRDKEMEEKTRDELREQWGAKEQRFFSSL